MNWIKQFVILFMFASGQLVQASVGTRSKLGAADEFETCVSRNLSASSLFNEKDREQINKIVMETRDRTHELIGDPENARTMLRLFAAALACVVADCDPSERPQREQACLNALEACARSLKNRTLETEIAKEMKKIFSAINREISHSDAISGDTESKKKDQLEKNTKMENQENLNDEIRQEKKENYYSEKESEVKERSRRAYSPPFRFPSFGMPMQPTPTLDSVIADKLLNSASFNNLFKFGLSQEDAIYFSRSMVTSGLSGFRYDITQEAVNRVSSAMTRLGSFAGSDDYAYAIGRSIASVLDAHSLTMFADGLDIGNALVYQLDSLLGSDSASASSFFGAVSVSSSGVPGQISGMASVQVNPGFVEPSFSIPSNPQNDKTLFQNRLAYFLTQSQTISETFCSGPVLGLYEVINSAFYDYGYSVSSTIATVVSNSLSMLPTEAACEQYADIISEIVADVLDKNGLIPTSDPQTITNAISDIISPNIEENPSFFGQEASSGSDYQLNPSFSDISFYPEIPAPLVNQDFDTTVSSSVPDTSFQQPRPTPTNSTEIILDASSLIQTPQRQDFSTELSLGGLSSSDGSKLSSDDLIVKNDSWVIVDSTVDVVTDLNQKFPNSEFVSTAFPIILEQSSDISVYIPNAKNAPELQVASTDKTTISEIVDITKSAEMTTPVPLSANFPLTTTVADLEATTPPPQKILRQNVFERSSQSPEFPTEEMVPPLKALDFAIGVENKQQDLQGTSGSSSDLKIERATESPPGSEDSEAIESSSKPQELFSTPSSTEAPTSSETPLPPYKPSEDPALKAPKPITDEISALVFADKVSSIVASSIGLIRSDKLEFEELCRKLNELAALVDIPPLTVFSEIPLIDYLLHVLNAVTYSLAGEK